MEDLISRKTILKHIEKIRQDALMMDDIHRASIIMNGTYLCEEAVEKIVRNQSSAQSERNKEKWIRESLVTQNYLYKCSICKKYSRTMYDYCPNCGADMRGE